MDYEVDDFVGLYKEALSPQLCEAAIEEFRNYEHLGLTISRKENEGAPDNIKKDTQLFSQNITETRGAECTREIIDVVKQCFNHYKSIFGVLENYRSIGILHYKVQKTEIGGGYHVWHSEDSDAESSKRVFSFIGYLNDVHEGGETELLYQYRRIKPEAGSLLIFPAGFTHTHRGNPPLSNTKYIVTGWVEWI